MYNFDLNNIILNNDSDSDSIFNNNSDSNNDSYFDSNNDSDYDSNSI